MLVYFLFFVYLVFGTFLLHVIIRRKIFPFRIYHTIAVVFFKVLMACLYGWVFLHYYGGDDTWNFFLESKDQTVTLMQHPRSFFHEFYPRYSLEMTGFQGWEAAKFYIVHFERWFMIKSLAILNLFSNSNYYVDVLLFEFLVVSGPLLLFKMVQQIFPLRTGMNFLLIFFIPSVVFWCSGIRAEALLLLFMVIVIYNSYACSAGKSKWRMIMIAAGFAGILLFRYELLPVFLPAWLALVLSFWKKERSPKYYTWIFSIAFIIFFVSLFLHPASQLSQPLIHAQKQFFALHGNTRFTLDSLAPGPVSFLKLFPQAVTNGIFRPYPWEGKNLLQSMSSIEVLFMVAGFFYFFLSARRKQQIDHPVYWLFLYYGLCQMILIGVVVPFPGAIVRYRIIPFLFLLLFLYSGNPMLQQKLRYRLFKIH